MIVEKIHNKRLKEQGISICSKYKSNDTILERNTDKTKRNDNIQNGICLEKDYYKNNKLLGINGGMTSHNIIANLAKMKVSTSVFGCCGEDLQGEIAINSLKKVTLFTFILCPFK